MKQDNYLKGRVGEKAAEDFIVKKGYQVLERNFRTRFGEIDLIVQKAEVVIFVEVKTKTGDSFGEPWEMVGSRKLEQVRKMGEVWNMKNNWEGQCWIDVVGVWLDRDGQVEKVEHWENVEG